MMALGEDDFPRVLVGNKVDLDSERYLFLPSILVLILLISRVISEAEGRELAAEWGCKFFETSAKQNQNISMLIFFITCINSQGDIFESVLSSIQKDEEPEVEESTCILM
jgi:GTPase SAR1 family protein